MSTVTKSQHFTVSAQQLWDIVGNVTRIDWVPVITSCRLDADIRSMEMTGVGIVQERILRRDPDTMLLEYGLINNPRVTLHRAILQVLPTDSGCELRWSTQIEPDALEPLIDNGMQTALTRLGEIAR
jgi:hypothetical protein